MAEINVLESQSIFDITAQEFGTLEELFVFLIDNDLSVNAKLTSGQKVTINKTNIGDEDVKNFVVLQNITMNNFQGDKTPPLLSGDFNDDFGNDFF